MPYSFLCLITFLYLTFCYWSAAKIFIFIFPEMKFFLNKTEKWVYLMEVMHQFQLYSFISFFGLWLFLIHGTLSVHCSAKTADGFRLGERKKQKGRNLSVIGTEQERKKT